MTAMAGSWRGDARALWRRAPLWRLSVLSAALLTLLFLLFPPTRGVDNAGVGATHEALANYVPPPAPAALRPRPTASGEILSPPVHRSAPIATATSGLITSPPPPRSADLSLATPGAVSGATGLNAALVGRLYSGSIRTMGYDVPLPPGNWALLSNQKTRLSLSNGANVGEGMMVYLGKIEDKKLVGITHIMAVRTVQGSLVKAQQTHIPKSSCEQNDLDPDGHWSCFMTTYSYFGNWSRWADRAADLRSYDRAPAGDLAAKGVPVPSDFIGAEFWRAEAWGVLLAEYMFSPEADGITSTQTLTFEDSDWTPAKLKTSPQRRAYVVKIDSWGKSFWPRFKQAFDAAASPSTR